MYRLIALLIALLALPLPAVADMYIIYRQGATVSGEVVDTGNPAPLLQSGDAAIPWTIVKGDMVAPNYTRSGSVTTYTPPAPPVPSPQVTQFKTAVLLDATIPNLDKLYLLNLVGVINDYPFNPAAVKAAWAIVKSTQAVSAATAATVEAAAVKFNMPLN